MLPSTGTLSFLYNAEQDTWGFDPKDSGSFQVAYSPPTGLTRQDLPPDLPEHGRFGLCELTFEPAVSLPPLESHAFESLATRVPRNALDPLYDELADHQEWASRSLLLGYPDQIQGDMQTECALVSGGLYCGDAAGYRDPRAAGLRKQAPEWQLLLQVASEDAAHMMWGDLGCLYYWMRTPALVAQRFADAWLILQCS